MATKLLAGMRGDARLRMLKPVLAKAEKKREHGDLVFRADFGRARVAVGNIATLVVPTFAWSRVEPAQPVPVVPAAAAAPVPTPPKK